MGGGGASPTATRSPTRCPPKPCVPCPNATACRRCPTSSPHCGRKREGAMQFPTIGLFERTRTILKEPETRRLKNRGHLARNRKFESISLQEREMLWGGRRGWQFRRLHQSMECRDAPTERFEQVPRGPGAR